MNTETKKVIVDAVRDCKADEKEDVRNLAIHALSLFEEAKGESAVDLIKLVIDGDKRQRGAAQASLIAMREAAIPDVIEKLIGSEDWSARIAGLSILTEIYMEDKKQNALHGVKEEKDKTPVESLTAALKNVVKEAIRELQQHG